MAGQVWFLGDTHIGHHKVAKLRGFDSTDKHDEAVVKSIFEVVDKRDVLVLMGDLAWNESKLRWMFSRLLELYSKKYNSKLDKLPFDVKVVQGNHDKSVYLLKLVNDVLINSYHSLIEYKRDDIKMIATHIPIHPQCLGNWSINIHGHTHGHNIGGVHARRYIQTSYEYMSRPISMFEILIEYRDIAWL